MAIDPKSLTVDFRSLLKMTVQERVEMAKLNPSYLASLTPTQYAMLFPDYYRKQLPDLGLSKATSGATPLGTISGGEESATPLPRYDGSTPKTGVDAPPAPPREKPKPSSVLKETWDQRLIREAEERRRPKQSFETDSTRTSIDKRGNVNKQQFYNQAVRTFRNSQLNGFVPKDGKKYGIDGTPESWARFAMRVAKVESNFNVNTTNPSDPGGSFGLFQWGKHYGITEENWKDPQAQLDAFVTFSQKWVVEGGGHILPEKGVEAKRYHGYGGFGSVFSTVRNNKVESSTAYSALTGLEEATEVLPPKTDEPGKVIPGGDPGSIGPVTPEPLTSLPEGLDPGIVEHYKTLKEEEQRKLLESMTGVSVETVNQYYREGKDTATPQVVREKTDDIMKGVDTSTFAVLEQSREQLSKKERASYPGNRIVSLDFNKYKGGKGVEIVIPDNATKEERAAAEAYVKNVKKYFEDRGYKNYPIRGVRTRSENKRGIRGFFHTEPFFANDKDAVDIISGDPAGYAEVVASTLGTLSGTRFIPPHTEKEQGASIPRGLSERQFALEKLIPELQKIKEIERSETVEPEAPPTESIAVEPQPNVTGDVVPEGQKGPPGASIIPETAPAAPTPQPKPETAPAAPTPKQPKLEPAPTPTATPVNPPTSKAVGDAMAKVGPPGPNQKDYRDDPAVKAEAASQAPTPTEKPSTEIDPIEVKQDDVPQKKYGGTTQSPTGEPITVSDSQTGQRLFTMNEEETLRKNKYGQIEVTPNTRRDSEEIESLAQKVKDEVRLQSEAREAAAETPATRMSQQPPQNNPNWSKTVTQISEDSGNVYKTASQGRAFDQARFIPRKDIFSLANATLKS